jgi:hypothetical protein
MRTLLALFVLTSACASSGANRVTPTTLVAPDGAQVLLDSLLRDKPATVLVWWASSCPCVKRYEARVRDVAARHGEVAFYHVASNADDGPEEIAGAKAPLPILHDVGGSLASQLGVRSTPTVVVLAPSGEVVYRGWVDNEHDLGDPDREPWLEDALRRIVAGDAALTQTPTWGCTVTRSLGQPGRCHTTPR